MRNIRRNTAILLAIIMTLAPSFTVIRAAPYTLYETSTTETVTSGATLEKITRFTSEGWLNIDVLRVDLSNPNIKLDTMVNSDSVRTLTGTKALAQSKGAVAAINGGFFNWLKEGGGYPDGPVVESGKMVTAASEYNKYNDSMATFSINNVNEILYNYWKTDIALTAPNGSAIPAAQYNKPSKDYNDITILDRRWGASSIGVSQTYPDLVEMVVVEGKVLEIRQAQPAVPIPQNGYVVVSRQAGAKLLTAGFKTGDPVGLSISTNPDWSKLTMAVTGSAILVKDGQIPSKFSMDIAGRHPRTIIGSAKDGKQLLLVTIDGRQQNSIGMTQAEAAQLMLDLGAYNALNLDGGGSTTMVARTPGTNALEVINSPSDGGARSISTAVGVFSVAPPSPLDGMIIDTPDPKVFVNTSLSLSLKGFDRYFNPSDVDAGQVHWTVSGVEGSFSGSTFYPKSTGEARVKATLGNVSAEIVLHVLSAPVQLILDEKTLSLSAGQTRIFAVSGRDKNGYSAAIRPADVTWSVSGSIGAFSEGTFTASGQGTGYIGASIGDTHAYCAVAVAENTSTIIDTFETGNGSFDVQPKTLPGSYALSGEQKHSGNYAGKLTYDFTNLEGTRAAYMVFPGAGKVLASNTAKLGLWVYNTHAGSNWLRAEVADSSGKKYLLDFARNLDWTGWKYVEASLKEVPPPVKLTKIYVVQISPVPDAGSIYLDDLSAVASVAPPPLDPGLAPQDTVPVDEANQSIKDYQETGASFRFSVFSDARAPKTLLEKILLLRLSEKISGGSYQAAAFTGGGSHDMAGSVKAKTIATGTGYQAFDISDNRFIQLDMSKQGLRTSNPAQWSWFLEQLNSAKGKNIFIFMAASPDTFSDALEASLWKEILGEYRQKTGKEIWVFYQGNGNSATLENGVRYITSAGFPAAGVAPENTDAVKYILVTVRDGKATYEFKPVLD